MTAGGIAGIATAAITVVIVGITVVLTLVITVASIAIPFWLIARISRAGRERRDKLMATGLAAPATVLSAQETGMYVNNRPMVRIALEVRPPEGAPFQASVDQLLSFLEAPRVQPGTAVEVRYEAANPKNLMIVGL